MTGQPHNTGAVPSLTHPPPAPAAPPAMAATQPRIDDTAEMPIYREVEATWFQTKGPGGPPADDMWSEPGWSSAVPPPPAPPIPAPPIPAPSIPAPRPEPVDWTSRWQTAADDGWRAARRAEEAPVRTQTMTGLPKRVPQAQLVPGGVESGSPATTQRNPDGVRGLLSAYHRGVQRGRGVDDGSANA